MKCASNFKLYQLSSDFELIIEKFISDELTSDDLKKIPGDFEDRVINESKYILNLEAEYEAVKKASDEMLKRASIISNHAEKLRKDLIFEIESTGLIDPIKCAQFTVKIYNNPPSLIINDPEIIPDVYKKVEQVVTIDKNAIKKDILDGFEIEGARMQTKKRLVIK